MGVGVLVSDDYLEFFYLLEFTLGGDRLFDALGVLFFLFGLMFAGLGWFLLADLALLFDYFDLCLAALREVLHWAFLEGVDEDGVFFGEVGLVDGVIVVAEETMDNAIHFFGPVSAQTQGILFNLRL